MTLDAHSVTLRANFVMLDTVCHAPSHSKLHRDAYTQNFSNFLEQPFLAFFCRDI